MTRVSAQSDHIFRWRSSNNLPASVAAIGSQINHPIGFGNHVKVVLNHHDTVAAVNEPVQNVNQLFNVGHVQAHCGFV